VTRLSPEDAENLRRSIAMLPDGTKALERQQAIELIEQLTDVIRERDALRAEVVALGFG
jgi:hypothetical protein